MGRRFCHMLGVGLGLVLLLGWASGVSQAQQGGPAGGARQALESFFRAMTAGDLALLTHGAAISGTVQGDQFTFNASDSGQVRTLPRGEIALMSFGEKSDQLVLLSGDTLTGTLQVSSLTIQLPTGVEITLPKSEVKTLILKISMPAPGSGPPSEAGRQSFFRIMRGLHAQNLFQLFVKSLTTYDLAIFPNQQLLSGAIVNEQFVFHTTLFGTLTLKASDVTSIELAADPESSRDFISLKTGDRLSGLLDEQSAIQFQPAALKDAEGKPVTLTLERGKVARVSFRLPASAFGGGQGPGFGGGPGH